MTRGVDDDLALRACLSVTSVPLWFNQTAPIEAE